MSNVTDFKCFECSRSFPANEIEYVCPACGGNLDVLYDYERIVLENFPSVYRVKCLNHTKPIKLSVDKKHLNSDGTIKDISLIP